MSQRNYYEHIYRNEKSVQQIREYILTNPLFWNSDKENAERHAEDQFDRWLHSLKGKGRLDRTTPQGRVLDAPFPGIRCRASKRI